MAKICPRFIVMFACIDQTINRHIYGTEKFVGTHTSPMDPIGRIITCAPHDVSSETVLNPSRVLPGLRSGEANFTNELAKKNHPDPPTPLSGYVVNSSN